MKDLKSVDEELVGLCPDALIQVDINQERFGGLIFFRHSDELGEYLVSTIKDEEGRFISFHKRPDSPVQGFVVSVFEEQHNLYSCYQSILELLEIRKNELIWKAPALENQN